MSAKSDRDWPEYWKDSNRPATAQSEVLAFGDMGNRTDCGKAASVHQPKPRDGKGTVLGAVAESEQLCLESGLLLGHWISCRGYWW